MHILTSRKYGPLAPCVDCSFHYFLFVYRVEHDRHALLIGSYSSAWLDWAKDFFQKGRSWFLLMVLVFQNLSLRRGISKPRLLFPRISAWKILEPYLLMSDVCRPEVYSVCCDIFASDVDLTSIARGAPAVSTGDLSLCCYGRDFEVEDWAGSCTLLERLPGILLRD